MSLLAVESLRIEALASRAPIVDGVSFTIEEGRSFGLVGESGCGKTTTAKALLGLLPPTIGVTAGSIRFRGGELLGLPRADLNRLRWNSIALVTQSAMNALDPVMRVGAQIVEAIRAHTRMRPSEASRRAAALFAQVGLDPAYVRRYPHEFSGGMRQRAIIAMAMALDPALIVADEPTTALDVIVQDEVFALLATIRARGRSLLLISHDLALVAENCDDVAVMYAGQIVEQGPAATLFAAPAHPYTIGLHNAFPELGDPREELIAIPGTPPAPGHAPAACRFAPRCPFAQPICRAQAPAPRPAGPAHTVACHFPGEATAFRRLGADPATWDRAALQPA